MRKVIGLIVCFILLIAISVALIMPQGGCTENARVKTFGATATIDLPAGQKLVNATWKEGNNLWYLTRPMRSDEKAETYRFQEKSSLGAVEGTFVLIEHN